MGQLSAVTNFLDFLRTAVVFVGKAIIWVIGQIGSAFAKLRNWLRVHVPFVEAIVQRHIHNPATIFIDIAVFVLFVYLAFGFVGYFSIYLGKNEGRFTETIATVYPLPAVKVDSSYVWAHKFLQRLRFLNTFNDQAPAATKKTLPTAADLRKQIASGLIEDQIILLEATELGISVSREEIETSYELQKKQTKDFEATLIKFYGMSPQEFKQIVAERILKEKVKNAVITRVKVRHILTTTESAANAALKELKAKKSFADVAKKYSQDSQTKNTGGELGYWAKGELTAAVSAAFEKQAFTIKVNAFSGPIQTKYGYHIIQVTEKNIHDFDTYAKWYEQALKDHQTKVYIPL
jgi:foldase protein PrsA